MKKEIPQILPLHDANLTPEQRLLHAILWRALKDIFCGAQHERLDALKFILSKKSCKYTWSFNWVCQEIDLCPVKIRDHIKEYRHKFSESYLYNMLLGR